MKITKILKHMPFILTVIAVIIVLINYIHPMLSDFYTVIIIYSLFFVSFMIELLQDIKHRQYTTSFFIIVVDVIKIVGLTFICYYFFSSDKITDIYLLAKRNINIKLLGSFIVLMILSKDLLESKRFEKSSKDIG